MKTILVVVMSGMILVSGCAFARILLKDVLTIHLIRVNSMIIYPIFILFVATYAFFFYMAWHKNEKLVRWCDNVNHVIDHSLVYGVCHTLVLFAVPIWGMIYSFYIY